MEKVTRKIRIALIVVDEEIQPRAECSFSTIDTYTECYQNKIKMPPIDVFEKDDGTFLLVDGFHRYRAALRAKNRQIWANIYDGSERDAKLFAVGANAEHGLPRNGKDKNKVVLRLLTDDEWSQWSDGQIAAICKVSQPFVSKLRRHLTQNGIESGAIRKTRNGRKISVKNIGKRSPKSNSKKNIENQEALSLDQQMELELKNSISQLDKGNHKTVSNYISELKNQVKNREKEIKELRFESNERSKTIRELVNLLKASQKQLEKSLNRKEKKERRERIKKAESIVLPFD